MKHTSVLLNSPIEFIESTKISPFVSKVQIKVCYVGDEPNRNHSIITKDVARKMAPSLRACPIVGFFNKRSPYILITPSDLVFEIKSIII